MSCLSRLLGLICALVPGLFLLWFSLNSLQAWPRLGIPTGPFYSLVSFITSLVCLYLGVTILFGRDKTEEPATPVVSPPEIPVAPTPIAPTPVAPTLVAAEPAPLRAAPLPVEVPAQMPVEVPASEPIETSAPATQSIFSKTDASSAPLDTPETRIRRLASTRPQWRVTAPQLAQLANLNMAIADATAREMAARGEAQIQAGPNGETVYVFDLANIND